MAPSATSPDGILAATYSLIYFFLTARSHDEAAAAVKKAAKNVVVLKENVKTDGLSLEEIVKWWKTKTILEEESDSSSETSDSNSDSDSDSSSSSSASDSSSDSSSSSSSSTLKSTTKESTLKPSVTTSITTGKSKDASSSSSSESDSDTSSGSDTDTDAPKSPKEGSKPATTKLNGSSTNITSDNPSARVVKKQKAENGTSVPTSIVTNSPIPSANNGKKSHKSNTPFQRVKFEHVIYHDERLKDNSFIAKGGSGNDYGIRANQDLIVTRGDGFRKEKNKKKRGSYRGGEITLVSHSVKFT